MPCRSGSPVTTRASPEIPSRSATAGWTGPIAHAEGDTATPVKQAYSPDGEEEADSPVKAAPDAQSMRGKRAAKAKVAAKAKPAKAKVAKATEEDEKPAKAKAAKTRMAKAHEAKDKVAKAKPSKRRAKADDDE